MSKPLKLVSYPHWDERSYRETVRCHLCKAFAATVQVRPASWWDWLCGRSGRLLNVETECVRCGAWFMFGLKPKRGSVAVVTRRAEGEP